MIAAHRRTKLAIASMAATAALTSSIAIAGADPNDDAFAAQVRNLGINFTSDQALINFAHSVCNDLASGRTRDAEAQYVASTSGANSGSQISIPQAAGFVAAVQQHYCPSQ